MTLPLALGWKTVGAAVRVDEGVCRVLTAFFSEATGKPAQTRCLREERLLCQYLIELSGTIRTDHADHSGNVLRIRMFAD